MHEGADELDALRCDFAARSMGIEAEADLTDALVQRYWCELEQRVAAVLRTRFPCTADMLGSACFDALVRRLIVERRGLNTLRQAEQAISGGWLIKQRELQALPWLGELVRLESALADMTDARTVRRRLPAKVLHFRSDWDVLRLHDWWRTGKQGVAPSPFAHVAAIILGRSGRLRIFRLPCVQPSIARAGSVDHATAPPGG